MSQRYYTTGPERAGRVRALFDRIAPRYDLINDLQSFGLHRLWKHRLLERPGINPGALALDVCCGTGDLASILSHLEARVVGLDFSSRMLAVARGRDSRPLYTQADALALPVPDSSFDLVTIGYGLRNLADFEQGISELLRVLKPGGRLLILDFGKPRNSLWRALYFGYLRLIVPLFGLILCGDAAAYGYILESLRKYPAQEGVSQLMRDRGCRDVVLENILGGVMSIHRVVKPVSLRQGDDVSLRARDFVGQ